MKRYGFGLVIAMLLLTACSRESAGPEAAAEIDIWEDELPIRQPWLRDQLPDDSLVYMRIPNVLGLFATPKGNSLDPALRSRVNVENVMAVQQGLIDNVYPEIPAMQNPAVRLAVQHIVSPIEMSGVFLPAPASVIAVTTNLQSEEEFTAVLGELGYSLAEPLDARNTGTIVGTPVPMMVQFDAATGRLLIHAGPGVNAQSFANMLDSLKPNEAHRMRTMESRIDGSGQGFFFWMDPQKAIPMMQMSVPREQFNQMMAAGLDRATGVAMGWGVADGKGRLSLLADIPTEDDRGWIPYVNNDVTATSVGAPDALFLLSIPPVEEFARLESLVLDSLPPDAVKEWRDAKVEMKQVTGIEIEEIFTAVGPELMLILDSAGDYLALRLRDENLWNSILERIAENTGSAPESRTIGGATYHYWSFASPVDELAEADAEMSWFGELYARQRDHFYWTVDGDYIYMASVPQILFDRKAMRPDTDVGDWLANTQGIHAEHAVMSVSGTSRKLTPRLYAFYLQVMQALADMAQVEIDNWSMPSAHELGLPERGAMGFTISLGNPTLAAEFTFENNPAEMVGSMGTVAAVGILAAIAIPAYQDYTVRAQISEGLVLAGGTKVQIAEYYAEYGRFPGPQEVADMASGPGAGRYVDQIAVEPDNGRIAITYFPEVAFTGGQIFLQPEVNDAGIIGWACMGTFQDKHLPAMCRQ